MSGLGKKAIRSLALESAVKLAECLNHPESLKAGAKSELRKIEAMLRALVTLRHREISGDLILSSDPEMITVNEVLAGYKWVTQLYQAEGHYLYFGQCQAGTDDEFRRDIDNGIWEARGFADTIVYLANESLLERLRPCPHCGRWFFGSGIYCSAKCKQAAYRSTPEFKARAAEYQKQYYRDVLSPVTAKRLRGKGKARSR